MNEYGPDLALIHHEGFSGFAERAAPGVLKMLWRGGIRDGLVIDAGCGSGVLAHELLAAGFDVFGFDPSTSMVELARLVSPGARFEVARIEDVALPECVAVTAIGEVLSHATPTALPRFFADVHRVLRPGGLLIFDLLTSAAGITESSQVQGDDWLVVSRNSIDGETVARTVTTWRRTGDDVRKQVESHQIQIWDPAAVRAMLRAAGFRVSERRSYGSCRLPPGYLVFVAKK